MNSLGISNAESVPENTMSLILKTYPVTPVGILRASPRVTILSPYLDNELNLRPRAKQNSADLSLVYYRGKVNEMAFLPRPWHHS